MAVRAYNVIELEYGALMASALIGIEPVWLVIVIIIAFVLVFFVFVGWTTMQALTGKAAETFRIVDTGLPPELSLAEGCSYHLFISHVRALPKRTDLVGLHASREDVSPSRIGQIWSSGQDQAATIKRQLQLLLPGVKVFLGNLTKGRTAPLSAACCSLLLPAAAAAAAC